MIHRPISPAAVHLGPSPERRHSAVHRAIAGLLCVTIASPGFAATPLADQPLFSNTGVPGNIALALSVEYPTAVRTAHTDGYASTSKFLGYFDPEKCYRYNNSVTVSGNGNNATVVQTPEADRYFYPAGTATARTCTDNEKFSGNFLNWALMQTIDPFRSVMTGGYRVRDEANLTVLERAWRSGQDESLSPNRTLPGTEVANATPFTGTAALRVRTVGGLGNRFRFTLTAPPQNGTDPLAGGTVTHYSNQNSATGNATTTVFEAFARVKVCDPSAGAGGVETNCKAYGANWKPEGLIQQYATRMRFSAFGYLNESGNGRDGGVMRARQKFVGPQTPVPGSAALPNEAAEWNPATGVFETNPDGTDATNTNTAYGTTTVTNSGVMNYLNKFGQIYPGNYKSNDPVSEMYYATLRYYRNLGNVSRWSTIAAGTSSDNIRAYLDGFPVITTWDDPIQYACQRNYVIGIGDVNTHADRNVPGNTQADLGNATMPAFDDPWNAQAATSKIGVMQAFQANTPLGTYSSGRSNGYLMAGLAYLANTQDIRPEADARFLGRQSVQTYWVDVLENGFHTNNQFYLTAKYGGFEVPNDAWDLSRETALPQSWWYTNPDTVGSGTGSQPRPDNYFTAGRPDLMESGLTKLFARIASQLREYSTSFALAAPQVETSGAFAYSSVYDANNWTGDIIVGTTQFDPDTNQPVVTTRLSVGERLNAQAATAGWDTRRRIVTYRPASGQTAASGVAFRWNSLSTAQQSALDTSYRSGTDGEAYLQYLRGNRVNEMSAPSAEDRFYRTRASLLGDIVGSKTRVVGPPVLNLSPTTNPGYAEFKQAYINRMPMVYVGANDGMLHAFRGATTASGDEALEGTELFAYVPSATFAGPDGTPNTSGLAALGNPSFVHRYFVNASPQVYDVDFKKTDGASVEAAVPTQWRSLLIGGMGKGGKSYYAIDVTDPAAMTTEAAVAGKVLWEFTDPDLGYTFGEPAVIKTARYGWVAILPSGYNTATGRGYLFVVNPRTGALIQKIDTGFGSTLQDAGLAHVNTFVNDRRDGTADAAYAGDLFGNIWRVDLRSLSTNYTARRIATVRQGVALDAAVQPITSRPRIEVSLKTGKRYIMFGTGRLLDDSDIASTQPQSFYALWDGTNAAFNTTDDAAGYFPITRSALTQVTDLSRGIADGDAGAKGWYYNFGLSPAGIAWRMITEPAIEAPQSLVAFAPMLPNGEACKPGGTSRIHVVNYATGVTDLMSGNAYTNYLETTSVVTDIDFYSVGGKRTAVGSTATGERNPLKTTPTANDGFRMLNWRELRVAD